MYKKGYSIFLGGGKRKRQKLLTSI